MLIDTVSVLGGGKDIVVYDIGLIVPRKSHLCIPRKGIALPQPQVSHSFVCERFIYFQDRPQTHECGN
jgi:hypothetical protein